MTTTRNDRIIEDEDVVDAELVPPTAGQEIAIHQPASPTVNDLSKSILAASNTEGWDQIDPAGMEPTDATSVPWLKMDRRLSKGFAYRDGWRRTAELIMLAQQDTRAWFAAPYDPKAPATRPDCSSDDGLRPRDDSPQKQAELCGDCPHSQWGANGEAPECSFGQVAMALELNRDDGDGDLTGGQFVRVRFSGKALSPWRRYRDSFSTRVPKLPIQAFITTVDLEPDPKGSEVLVPKFHASDDHLALSAMQPVIAERDRRLPDFRRDVSVVEQDADTAPAGRATPPPFETAFDGDGAAF